jgi:hypothetical protein
MVLPATCNDFGGSPAALMAGLLLSRQSTRL